MAKLTPILIVVLALLLAACGPAEPAATPQAEPEPTTLGVAAVTEGTVTMAGGSFQPHTLVVATGATVTWQNDDGVTHILTSDEGWFESGELELSAPVRRARHFSLPVQCTPQHGGGRRRHARRRGESGPL